MTQTRRKIVTDKPAKPVKNRVSTRKPKTKRPGLTHHEISERAYFIHLDEGASDELRNWLRAERELTAA